jgi:hypothetical protein
VVKIIFRRETFYGALSTLFIAYLILVIVGCSDKTSTIIHLIPQRGNVILSVDIPVVNRDPDLSKLANMDGIRSLLAQIQIEPERIARLVVFGDSQSQDEKYLGAILQGNFDVKHTLQNLEESGWKKEKRDGYILYCEDDPEGYITALGKDKLCIGTSEAIIDTLDVRNGKKKGANSIPACSKILSCFADNQDPLVFYIMIPQDILDMGYAGMDMLDAGMNLLSLGSIGAIMGKIGLVHGLGISINRSGDNFPIKLLCLMQNENSASFVSGSLNLLKGLASMLPSDHMSPQERQNMQSLNSMRISRSEDVLTVNLALPRRELMSSW